MARKKKTAPRNTHRVIVGDSRIMKEVKDGSVHLAVASPPKWNPGSWTRPGHIGDLRAPDAYFGSLALVWRECFRALLPGCRLCVHVSRELENAPAAQERKVSPRKEIEDACAAAGFAREAEIVWQKEEQQQAAPAAEVSCLPRDGVVESRHETILVFKKPGDAPRPEGGAVEKSKLSQREWKRLFNSYWVFPDAKVEKPWSPFPEELPRRLIKMYTYIGETVLDPFLGGGTTCLVARDGGRSSVGYEVVPKLADEIKGRIAGGQNQRQFSIERQQGIKRNGIEKKLRETPAAAKSHECPAPPPAPPVEAKAAPRPVKEPEKRPEKKETRPEREYTVAQVYGLDSFRLDDGREVKLLGVEAPAAFYSRNRGIYRQALNFANELVAGKKFTLHKSRRPKKSGAPENAYYISFPNHVMINGVLIRNGYALSDRNLSHENRGRFDDYEKEARSNDLAIWALSKTDSPRKGEGG